jgi:hypothetical protein
MPLQLCVFPTEEYLEFYKTDMEAATKKTKVSPYAPQTQKKLNAMTLKIVVNMKTEWKIDENFIRIALRYNVSVFLFLIIKYIIKHNLVEKDNR